MKAFRYHYEIAFFLSVYNKNKEVEVYKQIYNVFKIDSHPPATHYSYCIINNYY